MKTALAALAMVLASGWVMTASSKIPPLTPQELTEQAHLIIDGVVHRVEKVGPVEHDSCYGWQRHRAAVVVKGRLKGAPTAKVISVSYQTRVVDDKGCDGGRDSYHLQPEVRYRLYLQQAKGGTYTFFNSSCVQRLPKRKAAMTNPYKLAEAALKAYRNRDLSAYNKLLKHPYPPVPSMRVFDYAALLSKDDRVLGLYFTDQKAQHIVAVIRKSSPKGLAVWFEIDRVGGGFSVVTLKTGKQNPPMEISVEGQPGGLGR